MLRWCSRAGRFGARSVPGAYLTSRRAVRHQTALGPSNGGASPNGGRSTLRGASPQVVGLPLSGFGSSLVPPTSPSYKPYGPACQSLIDPGFTGECVVVDAPSGTVAGVVERETAAGAATAKAGVGGSAGSAGVQERDLVWRRAGRRWELALRRLFQDPGLPSLLWGDDVQRDHDPKLVFVTPSDQDGFGHTLDVVEGNGAVSLYRYLGQGFVVVPPAGGLVTYVPGWTEQQGPANAYDQTLIGQVHGGWRVLSEQYVPDRAALAQHSGAFSDSRAVPAS